MKKLTALFVASALVLGAGYASAAASAAKPAAKADDKAKEAKDPNVFDDWRLQCAKPEGSDKENCELTQFAIAMNKDAPAQAEGDAKGQLLLTAAIIRPVGSDSPRLVLRAPLGVLLQPMLVKVPGHKDLQVPFLRCDKNGCFSVQVGMAQEFMDAAKATEAAVTKDPKAPNGSVTLAFQVNQPDKGLQPTNVTVPLSMKGFSKGLAALEAKMGFVAPAPAKDAAKKK